MVVISRIMDFLKRRIWEVDLKAFPPVERLCLRYLRVFMLAGRGFLKDDCQRTASVLTYYSMLNTVPLVAVAFAIAQGFGLAKLVESQIIRIAEESGWQADLTNQILHFSRSLLEQAKGGVIAGLGVIFLLWTVVSIMGKIEDSFNAIWEVRRPRTLARKFTDYFAMMALAPILLVISASITVLVSSHVEVVVKEYASLGNLTDVIFFLLSLLPYVAIWVLLTILYLVMPNTRVSIRSCIVGGVAAGTLFQVIQWAYIKFQIGVASYGAIYGSFAALPLFLGWLQTSWMIVLFGSELANADRNYETFGYHPDCDRLLPAERRLLLLRVFHLVARRFMKGEEPADATGISSSLRIPLRLVRHLLRDLIGAGLVAEVSGGETADSSSVFQPARSPEEMTIRGVIEACEGRDGAASPDSDQIAGYLRALSADAAKSKANVRPMDIPVSSGP